MAVLAMVKLLDRWKRPILWGLALCYTALRAPDVLSGGGWQRWMFVPICVFLVWVFVADVRDALRGAAGRTPENDESGC